MTQVNWYDSCILQTLLACQAKSGKRYCFPSQDKILELLKTHYGIERTRRWLNYRLRYLQDNGFIKRVRRIKRNGVGTLTFRSTLYFLTKKTFLFFSRLAGFLVRCGIKVRKWWEEKKPAPVSQPGPAMEEVSTPPPEVQKKYIRQLLLSLGTR